MDEYYFDTMALTILQGRNFRIDDSVNAPRRHRQRAVRPALLANQDPIGKRFRLVDKDNAWVQVVGLAQSSKYLHRRAADGVRLPAVPGSNSRNG